MIKNEFTKRIAEGNSIILAISPPTIILVSREKKPCLLSFCLATLCPRDIHLIAPLFVAPSRTSLKFVGFEEEERRLGLVPLVSTSRQRRGVVYNLHQVSLSCPIISPSVSYTWLFLLLLPFNTESTANQLCIGNSIQRERKREKAMFIWTLFINRNFSDIWIWVSYTVCHLFLWINEFVRIYLWMDQLTWSSYVIFKISTWSFLNFTIKQKRKL